MIARVTRPDKGTTTVEIVGDGPPIVLAHGAGAGRNILHDGMRDRLVTAGFRWRHLTIPYREEGRGAPDRHDKLLACHRAVYDHLAAATRRAPFSSAESMGGRIGSHLPVAAPVGVFLGYPLVALGKTEPRDVSHLADLAAMLFIQGRGGRFGPDRFDHRRSWRGSPRRNSSRSPTQITAFRVPEARRHRPDGMLDHLAEVVVSWMHARCKAK